MHLKDGEIKAYHDRGLSPTASERVRAHLNRCPRCRDRSQVLLAASQRVATNLSMLDPQTTQDRRSINTARTELTARIQRKETEKMWNKLFSRNARPLWVGLAIVAILAIALTFAPVRAIANSFLGLFRVEQVTVVQFDPEQLEGQLDSASAQLELLFEENVNFEEMGDIQVASSAEAASNLAGFPVRLPSKIDGEPSLVVHPGTNVTITIDLERMQLLLNEIGRSDLQLPEAVDGTTVTISIPSQVNADYGTCEFDPEVARERGYDPDDSGFPGLPDCTVLIQMPSPTISAPPGLDISGIGEIYLQLLGMNSEQAANFAGNIDWASTLVIPIPRDLTSYQQVMVDGVSGTLITNQAYNDLRQYALVWVKDGYVYALSGPGSNATALSIANSLR